MALEGLTVVDTTLQPAFTAQEWQAIKAMCEPRRGPASDGDRDKTDKNG
jgi:hypothetical protein